MADRGPYAKSVAKREETVERTQAVLLRRAARIEEPLNPLEPARRP